MSGVHRGDRFIIDDPLDMDDPLKVLGARLKFGDWGGWTGEAYTSPVAIATALIGGVPTFVFSTPRRAQ